jgi:hypothetical protein
MMDKSIFESDTFLGLDAPSQKKVALEHFKETLAASPSYKKLDQEQRNKVYNNYLDEVIPKGVVESVVDKVEEFAKNPIGNIIGKREKPIEESKPKAKPKATAQAETAQEPKAKGTTPWDNLMDSPVKIDTRFVTSDPAKVKAAIDADKKAKQDKEDKRNQLLDDAPLEDRTLDLVFPLAGGIHKVKGEVASAVGKAAKNRELIEGGTKASVAGGAFAVGDIAGNVAGQAAGNVAGDMMSDEFKKENPNAAAAIQLGAGLVGGLGAGVMAERRALQLGEKRIREAKLSPAAQKIHTDAQAMIDSTREALNLPKDIPATTAQDDVIAAGLNAEYGKAKEAPSVGKEEVATDMNVGHKTEESIDAEAVKAAAKAEQEARVAAAHEEAMARKAALEGEQNPPADLADDIDVATKVEEPEMAVAPKPLIEELQDHPRYIDLIVMRRIV